MLLVPMCLAMTFCSCWHTKMYVNQSTGDSTRAAIQGTSSTAMKHEVYLPYKLSMMLYRCNNHDCGAVNGPERGPRLCSLGANVRWAVRHCNQKGSVDQYPPNKAGSHRLTDALMPQPAAALPLWHSDPEGRSFPKNLHLCPYWAAICPIKDL